MKHERFALRCADRPCAGRTMIAAAVLISASTRVQWMSLHKSLALTPAPADAYSTNCDAVKAAGAAPIQAGAPGRQSKYDRDGTEAVARPNRGDGAISSEFPGNEWVARPAAGLNTGPPCMQRGPNFQFAE